MAWKNKKLAKEYRRKHYLLNRDKYIKRAKEYYKKFPEKVKAASIKNRKNVDLIKKKITNQLWKKNNPDKILSYRLKSRFGITLSEYKALLEKHNNRCAICWTEGKEFLRKLQIDHDHKTGKIRGILCGNCNHGLGQFRDDVYRLQNAISYLKKMT